MSELFAGCWQRVARADAHRNTFAEAWNSFIENRAYGFGLDIELDGTGTLWGWPTGTIPDDFSLIVGEILYQYRAALDGAIYRAAIIESKQDPPPNENGLMFPISSTRKEFQNARRYVAPLSQKCRTFIERVQPYNTPELSADLLVFNFNRSLGILNDWARKDRHRSLHVVGSLASKATVMVIVPDTARLVNIEFVIKNEFLESKAKIAVFKIDGHTPGMNVYANPNLAVDIALNEIPPKCAPNDTFGNRLEAISRTVKMIIGQIEKIILAK
jgi:hypothetical protein